MNHREKSRQPNVAGVESPTEQDIISALARWQPHSEPDAKECAPGTCFCCDTVNLLLFNQSLMDALRSIVSQIHSGEADLQDALFSAYAFGLLTAQVMRERQSQERRMH